MQTTHTAPLRAFRVRIQPRGGVAFSYIGLFVSSIDAVFDALERGHKNCRISARVAS